MTDDERTEHRIMTNREVALADVQLVHDIEVHIKRVLRALQPIAEGPEVAAFSAEELGRAHRAAFIACALLERGLRDQLGEPLDVTEDEIVGRDGAIRESSAMAVRRAREWREKMQRQWQ